MSWHTSGYWPDMAWRLGLLPTLHQMKGLRWTWLAGVNGNYPQDGMPPTPPSPAPTRSSGLYTQASPSPAKLCTRMHTHAHTGTHTHTWISTLAQRTLFTIQSSACEVRGDAILLPQAGTEAQRG